MPLEKGFLRPKKVINNSRIDIGILLGTIFSAILYGFFYMFREAFRILSSQLGGRLLVELTPTENFYYNLFYGSIAAILGFYVFVKYVFENSINHKNTGVRLRQRQILNEQGYFMWTFLYAFSQFNIVIGIWFLMLTMQFDLNFIEEFPILLILIPIVLFLNIWPPILRLVGKKGYKWMIYSFVYISVLSLAYGNINLIDYQKANENLKENPVDLAYEIKVPLSISHERASRLSLMTDVYVVIEPNYHSDTVIYWNDANTKAELKHIRKHVQKEKDKLAESERDQLTINLHANKNVSLKVINDLKHELRKAGVNKIQYSTGFKYSKYPSYFPPFKYYGIKQTLSPWYLPAFKSFLDSAENLDISKYGIRLPESILYRLDDIHNSNRIEIKVGKDSVLLNNSLITKNELRTFVYKFIKKYAPNYTIIYTPNEAITYNRYIEYLDLIYYSIDKLRNEMSYNLYNQPFKDNTWDNKFDTIKIKYPGNIIEWTPEEKKLIKLTEKAAKVVYK